MNTDLDDTLTDLDLPLPHRRSGKVRISYDLPDHRRLFITTDRLSAFDRLIAAVPGKGQVLNQLSLWWFETTRDIVPNHALFAPDPNVLVAREARPLPVEVIVRGHITGVTPTSLWSRYAAGQRVIDGHRLPDGLRKNSALPEPLITPTTKAGDGGHDEPLTCDEVAARGLVAPELWVRVQTIARQLFARGSEVARRGGLVLADTKYEFGLDRDGELLLIDEVHTPTPRVSGSPPRHRSAGNAATSPRAPTKKSSAARWPRPAGTARDRPRSCPPQSGWKPRAFTCRLTKC